MSDSDVPQYLETLDGELIEEETDAPMTKYVDTMWASNPSLIDKNIEELELEDKQNREKLLSLTVLDKKRAETLEQQSAIYKQLLELTQTFLTIDKFADLPIYTKILKKSLRGVLELQGQASKIPLKLKIKRLRKNNNKIWDWISETARDWSKRLDLKIGADIIQQVDREAQKTTNFNLDTFINKEIKGNLNIKRETVKKVKHKSSKHRKLKFDVHEKLMNFMTPEKFELETKHEVLLNSLFGQKLPTKRTKVHLDVPLL